MSEPEVRIVRRIVPDVLDLARALWPEPTSDQTQADRVLLGLVGEPGCGKSTVAATLVALLGAEAVQVPMDGYHLADRVLRAHATLDRKGAPETFDGRGYLDFLRQVRADPQYTHFAPTFERDLEQPLANAIPVAAAHRFLVSEGNYLLLADEPWPEVAGCFDRIWFLQIDPAVRLSRLIARHVEYGKSLEQARDWVLAKDERNAELIRATRDRADLVLDVTDLALPHGPGQPEAAG